MRRAEARLIEVCAVVPTWTLPWYFRLFTARGLWLGQGEARRRYDRIAAEIPHHFPAQEVLLQQMSPDWSGTWEAMFEFTRRVAAWAPPGSPSKALIAKAHLERCITVGEKRAVAYLKQAQVQREVAEAAQGSVLHPAYRSGPERVDLHTTFGVLHAIAGADDSALPHFLALGSVVSAQTWSQLSGALLTKSAKARDRALKVGPR